LQYAPSEADEYSPTEADEVGTVAGLSIISSVTVPVVLSAPQPTKIIAKKKLPATTVNKIFLFIMILPDILD